MSDIFCGVRGEETEPAGSWGLQQPRHRPGSCSAVAITVLVQLDQGHEHQEFQDTHNFS